MKPDFYIEIKSSFLKITSLILFLACTQLTQAQRTFTICPGEEVVLSGFTEPAQPPAPPPGPVGTPNDYCIYGIERTLTPTDGLLERAGGGYIVSPSSTTSYLVSSRSVPGPSAPDGIPVSENCLSGPWSGDKFTVIVEDCTIQVCNITDPFTELPWLNELINQENENGFGYYDYIKLYDIEGENYIEVFSELPERNSQIYACNGTVFCERLDSLSCSQFNKVTELQTFYNTTCTEEGDTLNPAYNRVDLEAVKVTYPDSFWISRETSSNFQFEIKNNGPCYLYEADFVVEVNGEIIETKNWTGTLRPNKETTIRTEVKYNFKPDTRYDVKIWSLMPNGKRDLNFANDTLKKSYSFESMYQFSISRFDSPVPVLTDGLQDVSIEFYNYSNARFNDSINFNWSVNGEIQPPLISEDIFYNTQDREVVLGDFYFEKNMDYEIEAWIELNGKDEIPDKLVYFIPANSAKIDLDITKVTSDESKNIIITIQNRGNVRVDDFSVNWSANGVQQETIQASDHNLNWKPSYRNGSIFNEHAVLEIETPAISEDTRYTLDFNIELPSGYNDINLQNNNYVYEIDKEVDKIYQVCEGDSITLLVGEFSNYLDPVGFGGYCTECSIVFDTPKWIFNNEVIGSANTITIKPVHEGVYTFSTDARQICRDRCGSSPGIGAPGPQNSDISNYIFDDVKVKVVVKECQKEAPDCLNYFGSTSNRRDENGNKSYISSAEGNFIAYGENGQTLDFSSEYINFDYEIISPLLTRDANPEGNSGLIMQPVTITCFEEIPAQRIQYEDVCIGDQFEKPFEMPSGLGVGYEDYICSNIKSQSNENPSIESVVSENCDFNFEVKGLAEFNPFLQVGYESIEYSTYLQTIERPDPININWFFSFLFKEGCVAEESLVFSTYPWLAGFVNPADCTGESIYVYNADTYEFLVVKSDLGESMYNSNGDLICFSPAGGFSFIGLYNESRILNRWACDEGFQGKESKPGIQNNGIQIFPNPANGKVFINLQEHFDNTPIVSIYNVTGKKVQQIQPVLNDIFAGILELNVNKLDKGMYLVEVRTDYTTLTEKLLIE